MDSRSQSLRHRLQSLVGLSPRVAQRVVDEVMDEFDMTVDAFIARRHVELQQQGLSNAEIYARIQAELSTRRFRAPELSARQIRRRIYG